MGFSMLEGQEEDPYYFSDFYFDYNSEDVRYNYYNKHKDGFDLYKCYKDSKEYDNLNMINVRKNYDSLNMINVRKNFGFKYKNFDIYQVKTPNSGNKDARGYLKSFNSQ